MSGVNGTGRVFRLGDRTPEWLPVEIERDGAMVTLRLYVRGQRCPVSVAAAVDAVNDAYNDLMRVKDDDGNLVLGENGLPTYAPDPGNQVWSGRIADTLRAVVGGGPDDMGLTLDESQTIANDGDLAMEMLFTGKWFARREEPTTDPEAEGAAAPESPPSPSTGDGSSPASTSSMAPETGAA